LEKQVAIIHEQLRNRKDKPMVFIYHSFGSALMATLFRLYSAYYFPRVIGIIAIGFYPIRFVPLMTEEIKIGYKKTIEDLKGCIDENYNEYLNKCKGLSQKYIQNKYSYLCRNVIFSQGIGFSEMFLYLRQLPPVLKCIIYGRKDMYLSES
jgi:hypothetical protein